MKKNNKIVGYGALAASFAALSVNGQAVCNLTNDDAPLVFESSASGNNVSILAGIDIDADGTDDINFEQEGFAASTFGTQFVDVGVVGTNGGAILASSSGFLADASILSYGDMVSAGAGNFYSDTASSSFYVGFTLATAYAGFSSSDFNGGSPGYIGIEFDAGQGGNTNYGWVELTADGDDGTGLVTLTILSYGYEASGAPSAVGICCQANAGIFPAGN